MALRIEDAAVRSDTGRQRNANEDSFFTRPPLFVIADGMGGAQAGEVASKAAAESFDRELPGGAAGAGPRGDDRRGEPDDP
jgi:protein phosphatase